MRKEYVAIGAIAGVTLFVLASDKSKIDASISDVSNAPRGIRNKNPLNIRVTNDNWIGKIGDDGEFVIFDSVENGIRAAYKILKSYKSRGINTISKIIATWAPPTENVTSSYIDHVAEDMGISPTKVLSEYDYIPLIAHMIEHENGVNPYSLSTIREGVSTMWLVSKLVSKLVS